MNSILSSRSVSSTGTIFTVVIFLIFSAGWATNHFSTMVVVIHDQEAHSSLLVNGAFGVYAVGLFPCLLLGGLLADRFSSRPIMLLGSLLATLGNSILLAWQTTGGLFIGRFVVGLGVGLTISVGTAWASALRGAQGAVWAGIALSFGFAVGPVASGAIAYISPTSNKTSLPFLAAIGVSVLAILITLYIGTQRPHKNKPVDNTNTISNQQTGSIALSLMTSIPMALWVFSSTAIAMITLADRPSPQFDLGVFFPGIASLLAFTAAVVVQTLGRRYRWSPISGVFGALLAASGFILGGIDAKAPNMWLFTTSVLLLGMAYGLCLREGLLDVEEFSPSYRRGTTLGIFYVFAYLGFALPVLLEWAFPSGDYMPPLVILGMLSVGSALIRVIQIRSGRLIRH